MKDLNITYYYGQIREEFRGDNALFMELDSRGKPIFKRIPLSSDELSRYTEKMHSPMRAYIGVTPKAQTRLEERFGEGRLQSAFDLDVQIVRKEIVQRRSEEIEDMQIAVASNIAASGM
jgi:hypothetical protein